MKMLKRKDAGRGHAAGRFLRGLARPLRRLLLFLLVLEVTGMAHFIFEAAGQSENSCEKGCPGEDEPSGVECPPFCPSCQCAHASRPALPALDEMLFIGSNPPVGVLRFPAADTRQDDPEPRRIFHPPRR